jgi:hypothetical protein
MMMIICRQVSHDTHERVTLVILESFLLNKSDTDDADDDDDLQADFHIYKSEKILKKRREKLVWNLLLLLQCIVVLLLLLSKVTTDFLPIP